MFERLWTLPSEGPVASGALGNAALGPQYAVIANSIVELSTGAVLWSADGPAVGFDGEQVVVVRRDGDRWTGIERRDARTGQVVATADLRRGDGGAAQLRAGQAGLGLAPGRLVYSHLGRVAAFALDTGVEAWTHDTGSTRSDVVVSGDLVAIAGEREVTAHDAATGEIRWRVPGEASAVRPSPRGGFLLAQGDVFVERDAAGREVRTIPGRVVSAEGALVATVVGRDVLVLDGEGREVDRIRPSGERDYLAVPGLCDGAVVYFRSDDKTIWWRASGGRERPVATVSDKTATTKTGTASATATLTEPPRCAGSVLLVQDWYISAYRIPTS